MNEDEAPTMVELLTFQLAYQEYALDIMSVREIRGWTKATPLPHAPDYMKGVVNLRGTVLPVIDLALRLGLDPSQHSDRSVIIVVEDSDIMTGLLVDAVSDIIALKSDDLLPPPDTQSTGGPSVVNALTVLDDRMIRVLNLSSIVTIPESSAA